MLTISVVLVAKLDAGKERLRSVLDNAAGITVVGEASNLLEAKTLLAVLDPDVVVVNPSGPDGLNAIHDMSVRLPEVPILAVVDLPRHKQSLPRLLRAGARGYVFQQEPPDRWLSAIRIIAGSDNCYLSPALVGMLRKARLTAGD